MQFSFVARNGDLFSFYRTNQPAPSQQDIDRANANLRKAMNVRVRNAKYSNEYNCHGLTFISRLGRFAWFTDDVPQLLIAHDYAHIGGTLNMDVDPITVTAKIARGDVIVYLDSGSVKHTGIVWTVKGAGTKMRVTILSKWGDMSEYFHDYRVVPPSYGKTVEFWTDRRV